MNQKEADLVRLIFNRFLRVGSATQLAQELRRAGHTTKTWTTQDGKHRPGKPIDKCAIYKILNNRVYLGEAVHKGTRYPGEHAAIIDQGTWDKVHAILAENTVAHANGTRAQTPVAEGSDLCARWARDDTVALAQELFYPRCAPELDGVGQKAGIRTTWKTCAAERRLLIPAE